MPFVLSHGLREEVTLDCRLGLRPGSTLSKIDFQPVKGFLRFGASDEQHYTPNRTDVGPFFLGARYIALPASDFVSRKILYR